MRCTATLLLLLPGLLLPALRVGADGPGSTARPSDMRSGSLLIDDGGGLRAAPRISTDVEMRVTGLVARSRVVQRFRNPTSEWVEGVYVFPLPDGAAVDRLRMRIGERVIEGRVLERQAARSRYEKARSEGRRSSLVEQERPNVFTTSIAHLGPGETIEVEIAYQEDVPFESGRFSLRFPMVVTPRYVPGRTAVEGFDGSGWGVNTEAVPDAERITPPVAAPGSGWTHPVRISVRLEAGLRLAEVTSPSHPIHVAAREGHVYEISLADGEAPADSDFLLEWRPVAADVPTAALFREPLEGDDYALLMIVPPSPGAVEKVRLSRETIFVIDTSGSMAGESIVQARAALEDGLGRLGPDDVFNVIRFASDHERLFREPRHADARTLAEARRWVRGLRAEGGTEMLPALRLALRSDAERAALRQVVFITDGAVGNEARLFEAIRAELGRSRLYTVGIGSAPNGHFMRRAAEHGRGTFTFVSSPDRVAERMSGLFAKLESPVLHDLELRFDVAGVEAWPSRIPDLYLGEPVVVAARLPPTATSVELTGRRGSEAMRLELPLGGVSARAGIARLWARRKVAALMGSLHGGAELSRVADEVTRLGLRHHLVTRWTSLVAVDVTPSAPAEVDPATRPVPSMSPRGWSLGGTPEPTDAVPGAADPGAAFSLRLAANVTAFAPSSVATVGQLPRGATPAAVWVWLGSVLCGVAALLWRPGRRR